MNANNNGIPGFLERAIAASGETLATLAPGEVISLAIDLPGSTLARCQGFSGDCRWVSPPTGRAFYAAGKAVEGSRDALDRLLSQAGVWRRIGGAFALPLAFFTLPPATAKQDLSFFVPRVLFRREGDAWSVILSAGHDGRSPQEIAGDWLTLADSILSPAGLGGEARIEGSEATPDETTWKARVAETSAAIRHGRFDKAVLARRLVLRLAEPVDPNRLVDRLAAYNAGSNIFSLPHGGGHVVAASPERLAVKKGRDILSDGLAGTARNAGAAPVDDAAESALFASAKERSEHAIVVDAIAADLEDFCETLERPSAPGFMHLSRVTHLWTPLSGRLKPGVGLLDVAERLHPTPAVSGFPRETALAWLNELGEERDGLYSGVAGWIDADGDGEAAVVLRTAFFAGREASLWAGAGIMAQSDPAAEWMETEMKLATMLDLFADK
ncbi:menaquinone-specific isochorismate synthase [Rhodopseudomonas julia]|uniref:isochorismate synthase n=1 Tax=Rhodopseudomonas julia TaxID=200617 RepID=A0ABU0C1K0_9BRAD|nr:isochorismate synthase [Rhodopseudomonas julia]MDQ0324387.1 menaquinone-specific isochorismate synthase [Rhodopseudomonas julia]